MSELAEMSKELQEMNLKITDILNEFMRKYPQVMIKGIELLDMSRFSNKAVYSIIKTQIKASVE